MSAKEVKAGDSISIYWDGDKKWYYGQVLSYDEASGSCQVLYDDGEKEVINLNVDKYKIHSNKDSARKAAFSGGSSGNRQWKLLKETLFDIADRLPYKGVHAMKDDWWEKWKFKVSSASESKNVALMSFSIIEISRQLKANVSTEWWKSQKTAWEKEVVEAKTSVQLASSVNDLLTKAVNWARARQLFSDPSSQRGTSKLQTGLGDDVALDQAENKTSPQPSGRKTRRSNLREEPEFNIKRNSRASKKSKQATVEELGIVGQEPFLDKEVVTEKQAKPTEVLPSNLPLQNCKERDDSLVATGENLGLEEQDNRSHKTLEKGKVNGDAHIEEPLHEGAADSSVQTAFTSVQNVDTQVQNGDTRETSDLRTHSSQRRGKEMVEFREDHGISKSQNETKSPLGGESLAFTDQNLVSEDMYVFMKAKYAQDKTFMKLYNLMQKEKSELTTAQASSISEYSLQDGFLFFQNKLCVVNDEIFRHELIHKCHLSSGHEHLDSDVTSQLLQTSFYWPNMRKDVQKYVGSCSTCLNPNKSGIKNLSGDPELLNSPWQSVILKFVDGIPVSSGGHDCILILVDRMSKQAHFVATKKTFTALEMARIYFTDIVRLHGLPKFILSDDASIFKNDFWISMWKRFGANIDFNLIQIAENDAEVGKVDKILEDLLRSYVASQQQQWQENLHLVEFVYNNSIFSSTGISPFKAIYGYEFHVPSSFPVTTKQTDQVSEFVTSTINLLHIIDRNFSRLAEKSKIANGPSEAHEMVQAGEQSSSPSKDVASSGQASFQHARKRRKHSRYAKDQGRRIIS